MSFIDIAERTGFDKGYALGYLKGLLRAVEIVLVQKFGPDGVALLADVRRVEHPIRLQHLFEMLCTRSDLTDVRQALTRKSSLPG